MRRPHVPEPCSRTLGPAGEPSIETFLDRFVGGWFEMFPAVGYPAPGDPTSFLHGEVVRLPWDVVELTSTAVEARVRTLRAPFLVIRRLEVEASTLDIEERVENVGAESATYLWGHHPCFERATFAGGRIELDAAAASVPAPAFDPAATILRPGETFPWPQARGRDGATVDVATVPLEPDGRVDHVCLRLGGGRVRLTAPRYGRALALELELEHFPYVLLWENFRAGGGWPFWRDADTFAIEPSSNPGRSVADASAAGAIRTLEPGGTLETSLRVAWEPLAG